MLVGESGVLRMKRYLIMFNNIADNLDQKTKWGEIKCLKRRV